jgi:hypothetical protein
LLKSLEWTYYIPIILSPVIGAYWSTRLARLSLFDRVLLVFCATTFGVAIAFCGYFHTGTRAVLAFIASLISLSLIGAISWRHGLQ